MKIKKIIIIFLAFLAIAIALYGVWYWQYTIENQPIRQENEIR